MIWPLNDLAQSGSFDDSDAVDVRARTVVWIVLFEIIFGIVAAVVGNIVSCYTQNPGSVLLWMSVTK